MMPSHPEYFLIADQAEAGRPVGRGWRGAAAAACAVCGACGFLAASTQGLGREVRHNGLPAVLYRSQGLLGTAPSRAEVGRRPDIHSSRRASGQPRGASAVRRSRPTPGEAEGPDTEAEDQAREGPGALPDEGFPADLPQPQLTDADGKVVPEERSNYPLWAFRNVMGLLGLATAVNTLVYNTLPDLLVAVLASSAYAVLLHPLDTYKTRLQLEQPGIDSQGVLGLYSGLGWGVLKEGVARALWMSAFIAFSSAPFQLMNPAGTLLAGSMAVLISSFLRIPFELMCRRRQAGVLSRSVSLRAVRTMFRRQNWQLAVGWLAVAFRDLQTLLWSAALFHHFEDWVPIFVHSPVPIVAQLIAWASLCAGLASLPSAPSDTVASELLTEPPAQVDTPYPGRARAYGLLGMAERVVVAFRGLRQRGGVRRLFRGWLPRFLYNVLSTGIFISALVALTAYPQQFQGRGWQ
eukprot:EG_transcript_10036